jgi:hypothetical protein
MPFNGDFGTTSEDKVPSHDFYSQNMRNKGVLEGSWQMRQAYAQNSPSAGSEVGAPAFQTSYARDANQSLGPGTNPLAYRGRGVTNTSPVPNPGESYNSKRIEGSGSNEENTVRNFFGAKGKIKKSKESTPGKGSPGGQESDDGMAIASNNNVKVAKNARQSGNQSGGANIQAGGDIDAGSSVGFGATNTGSGVQQIGGENSRQTHNQFMFDPNHPRWNGDPGDKPTADKPKADKPKADTPKEDTPTESTPPTTGESPVAPDQGDNFGGGDPRRVQKTRRKGTPSEPYTRPVGRKVGGRPDSSVASWEHADMGGRDMGLPRPGEPGGDGVGGMPPQYARMDKGTPPTTGAPTPTTGTEVELWRGNGTPTTGAPPDQPQATPPTGTPTTGAPPKGPGIFGRMWNRAADRVMTAPGGGPINFGPGAADAAPHPDVANWQNAQSRGLPAGPTSMGELGTGAPTPMGEIGPGTRVMGAIGAGDSPASAPIQQVNPRGTYGHPMNGSFGGRGPTRGAPQTTRFGDMGMGVPMQSSAPAGGMPPQYEGMGGDYDASAQPGFGAPGYTGTSRHPRPGGPRTPYVGPSRHPRPPLAAGSSPYVGPSRHPRPGQSSPSQGVEASRRFGVESDDYGRPTDQNY